MPERKGVAAGPGFNLKIVGRHVGVEKKFARTVRS